MKRKLLALFVAVGLVGNTFAQEETQQAVGTTIGGTADGVCRVSVALKGGIDYLRASDQKVQPEFGADIQFTINPLWGFGLEYMYIMNNRDAANGYPAFDSQINDVTLFGSINLSNLVAKYRSSGWQKWNVYANAGGGVSISSYEAGSVKESGKVKPVFVGGLALEWNAFEHVAFGLDAQYRWHTNTDFIGHLGAGRSLASANFSVRYKFHGANNTRSMALVNYEPTVTISDGSILKALEASEKEYAARTARLESQIMDQNSTIQKLQSQVKETQDSLKSHIDRTKEPVKYIPTTEEVAIIKTAFSQLQFESGKDIIKQSSYASLDGLAELLKQHPEWSVILKGYTDSSGNAAKNLQLSKDRASAVKAYMVNKGASAANIQTFGYGSADPIAPNSTAAGRVQNRRVEIELFSK
jgi:OOP family OmpA-OmpF porin